MTSRPTVRKEPITAEMLGIIVSKFYSGGLKDLRVCSMMLLAYIYAAFLRFNEMVNLKICDVAWIYTCSSGGDRKIYLFGCNVA